MTAATFASVVLMCDIGGAVETWPSAAMLACGIAVIAAAVIIATVRFRAVFAISVSSSYPEAGNGGNNSHRETFRCFEWRCAALRRLGLQCARPCYKRRP